MTDRPFVFLACMQRSGSTVLAEALTQLPRAFVFREPGFGFGRARFFPEDREAWKALGVDLDAFRRRAAAEGAGDPETVVRAFREEVYPLLKKRVDQVGVKEIRLDGWELLLDAFPDARVVMTGRDPRDLYLSLRERVVERGKDWPGRFGPESVARRLLETFRHQRAIAQRTEALLVRYEDLCTDPGVVRNVLAFVESPLSEPGEIGAFNRKHPRRAYEAALHGERLSPQRVGRHLRVSDRRVCEECRRMFALMREYARFWGYREEGGS